MKRPSSSNPGQPQKRRRADPSAPLEPADQQASIQSYLHHATKLLAKALKKSKTFELQKLVRKLKSEREPKEGELNAATAADLEAQLEALKALSLDTLPPHLLHTRLPKIPSLRPILTSVLSTLTSSKLPELDPKSPAGKARNKVLAHKAVKEAWDEVARAVTKRMGEDVPERVVKEEKKPAVKLVAATGGSGGEPTKAVAREGEPQPEKRLSKRAERAAKAAAKAALPKPKPAGMDPGRKALLEAVAAGEVSDSEDGDSEEGFESGEELGGEIESDDDDDEVRREMARLGGAGDASDSEADSDDDDGPVDDISDIPSDAESTSSFPAAKSKSSKGKATSRKMATSSAFLPSLAGGYISYSDSDGEDAQWVKDAEKGEKKERKNRRGQRARRAIWEQKYGSGAKHIVATTGAPAAPTKSKAAKAAAAKLAKNPSRATAPTRPAFNANNANTQPIVPRKPPAVIAAGSTVESGMHASWEAKRREKEAIANAMAGGASSGKKIKFD
ncbi:hypothetical protein MNV49_002398 [Pseudohyphozyma bogoriensis]|nr:hypothetical protein MNV49_002398 [Pseudohyphozyma bogoriensis]